MYPDILHERVIHSGWRGADFSDQYAAFLWMTIVQTNSLTSGRYLTLLTMISLMRFVATGKFSLVCEDVR